jgi:hypothetical protein
VVSTFVVGGVLVAAFVGFNIGGSSAGVAFGPTVGSRLVRKVTAGGLFVGFAFLGAWTIGRNVIETMSNGIVPAAQFTPAASIGVLFFTGAALMLSNLYGVPASTSMTAVGAIVGLGGARCRPGRQHVFVRVGPLSGMADFDLDLRAVEDQLEEADGDGSGDHELILDRLDGTTPPGDRVAAVEDGAVLVLAVEGDVNELAAGFARRIRDDGGTLVTFREFLIVTPPGIGIDASRLD